MAAVIPAKSIDSLPGYAFVAENFDRLLIAEPRLPEKLSTMTGLDISTCQQAVLEYPRYVFLYILSRKQLPAPELMLQVRALDLQYGNASCWQQTIGEGENSSQASMFIPEQHKNHVSHVLPYLRMRSLYWITFGHEPPTSIWPNPMAELERAKENKTFMSSRTGRIIGRIALTCFYGFIAFFVALAVRDLIQRLESPKDWLMPVVMFGGFLLFAIKNMTCPVCKRRKLKASVGGKFEIGDPTEEALEQKKCAYCGYAYWHKYSTSGGGGG